MRLLLSSDLLPSKFLNVIASGVPEMMDLLACFFPGGLMDSPEKFRAGFPGVVETTMSHLKIIQDRALKGESFSWMIMLLIVY